MAAVSVPSPTTPSQLDHAAQGRRLVEGDELAYDYFGSPDRPAGAIFLHGFGGGRAALRKHAEAIATAGAAALAVDLSSLTRGGTWRELFVDRCVRSAQLRNVRQVVDHAAWFGKHPLALVGHSAGGALALEAAVALQKAGHPPSIVVLLDAVPWPPTCEVAMEFDLEATMLVSIRADPSAWNNKGFIAEALRRIPPARAGRLVDVHVLGARHGDPLEPDWRLRALGLVGRGHDAMFELTKAYLQQGLSLAAPGAELPGDATLGALCIQSVAVALPCNSAPMAT